MDEKLIENEVQYQIAKTILLTILNEGGIDREQYERMKRLLLKRFVPFIEVLNEDAIWAKKK